MRFFKSAAAAVLLVIAGAVAVATTDFGTSDPLPYRVLAHAPAPAPGKIEIVEFFWFSCPHCYDFEPVLRGWIARHDADVTLRRVPVGLRPMQLPQQRLYYTMQAIAPGAATDQRVFDTIHAGKNPLDKEDLMGSYAASIGLDRQQFSTVFHSTTVTRQVEQGDSLQKSWGVTNVPTVVVGGRYVTSPAMAAVNMPLWNQTAAQRHTATVAILDSLLSRARQEAHAAAQPGAVL